MTHHAAPTNSHAIASSNAERSAFVRGHRNHTRVKLTIVSPISPMPPVRSSAGAIAATPAAYLDPRPAASCAGRGSFSSVAWMPVAAGPRISLCTNPARVSFASFLKSLTSVVSACCVRSTQSGAVRCSIKADVIRETFEE